MLIPILKDLIKGKEDSLEATVTENNEVVEEGEICLIHEIDKCKNCGATFKTQDQLRIHIDAEHILLEPAKRKRYNSEGSATKLIPEADLISQMSEAVRIVNDKREELEKRVKIDRET